MQKSKNSNMAKTIGIGMAIGGAAGLVGSAAMGKSSNHSSYKKTMNKAIKSVTQMLNSAQAMMK